MLVQFSVKNYKSIKDKVTLDFQEGCIRKHKEGLSSGNNEDKILPVVAIYGTNGGGKSNLLEAFYVLLDRVKFPLDSKLSQDCTFSRIHEPPAIEPYAFSEEAKANPTEFELIFRTEITEYRYVLHILKNKIVYESFQRIKTDTNRISYIFKRSKDEIRFCSEFGHCNSPRYIDVIPEVLPYIASLGFSYGYRNNETVKDYVTYILNKIHFFDLTVFMEDDYILNIPIDKKIMDLFINALKEIDTGIEDVRSGEDQSIYIKHLVYGCISETPLEDESRGIRKIFNIVLNILYYLINGGTIVVDDLDVNLHPAIVRYIIGLFSNPSINKNKAQLIFTAHDLSIMDSEVFRKGGFYIVAKGNEQNTQLYSLKESKDENDK